MKGHERRGEEWLEKKEFFDDLNVTEAAFSFLFFRLLLAYSAQDHPVSEAHSF
jgi:hypothetical protein